MVKASYSKTITSWIIKMVMKSADGTTAVEAWHIAKPTIDLNPIHLVQLQKEVLLV